MWYGEQRQVIDTAPEPQSPTQNTALDDRAMHSNIEKLKAKPVTSRKHDNVKRTVLHDNELQCTVTAICRAVLHTVQDLLQIFSTYNRSSGLICHQMFERAWKLMYADGVTI